MVGCLEQDALGQLSDPLAQLFGGEVFGRRLAVDARRQNAAEQANRVAFDVRRGPGRAHIGAPEHLDQVQEVGPPIGNVHAFKWRWVRQKAVSKVGIAPVADLVVEQDQRLGMVGSTSRFLGL